MYRSITGPRRAILLLFLLLLALIFVLPRQSQDVLQRMGGPVAEIVALPLQGIAAFTGGIQHLWDGYVALQDVHLENQRLRREIEFLRGQNNELREVASGSQRLSRLLGFKQRQWPQAVATKVIGRDSTNWYRGLVLDKGEHAGIRPEMGVITPAGLVGRVVKTTAFTSIVLLVADPNTAVTALIQRTRDEGIVTGTLQGLVRLKYIPLLSPVREGDVVVTSGLAGKFPKGLMVGVVKRIEKTEDDLFKSALLVPVVDFSRLEEVLVITSPRPSDEARPGPVPPTVPSTEGTPKP